MFSGDCSYRQNVVRVKVYLFIHAFIFVCCFCASCWRIKIFESKLIDNRQSSINYRENYADAMTVSEDWLICDVSQHSVKVV